MIRAGAVFAVFCAILAAEPPASPHSQSVAFPALARQAEEARAAGRFPEAIRLYRDALRERPKWSDGWWALGTIYYDQDRFEEARQAMERFTAVASDPAPGLGLLGLCEYETHDYPLALQHFAAWAAKKPRASNELIAVGYFHWALLLIREGQFERALVLLDARAKLGNTGPALDEAMGLAALRIADLPEDYPAEEREPVWLAGKAEEQLALRHLERAEQNARKLLAHYDALPNVHYFLATILLDAHRDEAAAREFARELEISPRHVAAMVQLAMCRVASGEPDKALTLARDALALDSGNFPAHKVMGDALLALERYPEGAHELEIARGLAPESAMVRYALSRAYTAMGREADAKRERDAFAALKQREQGKTSK